MAGAKFNESLVLDFENPESTAQVEDVLARHLYKLGSVKESYMGALAEREKNYPTALEVGEINVAIPHCDAENANEAAVCVGILRKPVDWRRMDDPDATTPVRLVFMLALNEAHSHLEMIQKIIGVIQDQEFAKKLAESNTHEAYELLAPRFAE